MDGDPQAIRLTAKPRQCMYDAASETVTIVRDPQTSFTNVAAATKYLETIVSRALNKLNAV
jgi:hypothetical protein